MKYLLVLLLGFALHPALEEVYDYAWYQQYYVCSELIPELSKEQPLTSRFRCVEEKSLTVQVLSKVLWRPTLASKADDERWGNPE